MFELEILWEKKFVSTPVVSVTNVKFDYCSTVTFRKGRQMYNIMLQIGKMFPIHHVMQCVQYQYPKHTSAYNIYTQMYVLKIKWACIQPLHGYEANINQANIVNQ